MQVEINQVTRYKPELGRPDVTPYAMMLTSQSGGWVKFEDYEKLKKAYDNILCRLTIVEPDTTGVQQARSESGAG